MASLSNFFRSGSSSFHMIYPILHFLRNAVTDLVISGFSTDLFYIPINLDLVSSVGIIHVSFLPNRE